MQLKPAENRLRSGTATLSQKRWDVSRFVFYQETGQEVCVEVFPFLSASSNASRVILMKEGNHPLPRPRSCCRAPAAPLAHPQFVRLRRTEDRRIRV